MSPPRWFAVGSADGSQPDAGVRAADKALLHEDAKLVIVFCSHSGTPAPSTFQVHGDQVLTNSVVAAGIASNAPLGIGVRHGLRPVGKAMLVTRSGANQVHSLDDRPALDVYLEHLAVAEPYSMNQERLTPLALTHPLGLRRHNGEEVVRFVSGADFATRSLSCMAEVPQGALIWIMEGDAESVLGATDAACSAALTFLEERAPLGMLAFDCIARRNVLGETGIQAEIERLATSAGGAPVARFYTYGEIAGTPGMRGFHNQTLVVLSIG
jgi:hypothetical protein